jgi:hypothetical protein
MNTPEQDLIFYLWDREVQGLDPFGLSSLLGHKGRSRRQVRGEIAS